MEFDRQLSDLLGEFARTVGADFPIHSILDHLVGWIVSVLPIGTAAITLGSHDDSPRHIAAADPLGLHFAQLQAEAGEGPGLKAGLGGHVVVVSDLRIDDRFPKFAPRAVAIGLMAVFAFPLRHGERQLGALELYGNAAGPLDAGAMIAAQTLADVAAAYFINARPAPIVALSPLGAEPQPSRS